MVGAHNSSSAGIADKTRDQVRDKLRPLFNNIRVRHSSPGVFCVKPFFLMPRL